MGQLLVGEKARLRAVKEVARPDLPVGRILDGDCIEAMRSLPDACVDMIFADPPYNLDQATFEKLVELIFANELLQEDGMMVIEHSKYTKLDHMINFSFKKSYGGSIFSFFEIDNGNDEEANETEDSDEG